MNKEINVEKALVEIQNSYKISYKKETIFPVVQTGQAVA
jgi:hypothetical protein